MAVAGFTPAGVDAQIRGLNKFMSGLGRMDKGIGGLKTPASAASRALLRVGSILGGVVLNSLVAFGKAAIQEGRAFTKAMSNVQAISGAVGSEFAKLEAQARQLGATTKFTAVEAAEGMTFLAQAGFETTDILAVMPATLDLAAAANLGLGKSADIVSNILKGFGQETDQTGRFVDVLTNTFTTSNTNLTQLGSAMRNVAPVASKLGLSVEGTAAALGKMADAGIQSGAAGTQLKNALLNLTAPSAQQTALMKELGIEIFNASGEMKTLPEIVGAVNKGLSGLSEKQQIAAIKTLAGKRAIAGFAVLLNEGEASLADYTQKLTASGTASEIAGIQLDNLEGDITLLGSAFSGFKLAAFDLMEPTLRAASKALTKWVGDFTKGADAWNRVFKDVAAIQEWREENVRAAIEAGKSYGPYQRQVALAAEATEELIRANEEYIPTATEIATRSEAQARAMSLVTQESTVSASAIAKLLSETLGLAGAEVIASQQAVELGRIRTTMVTDADRLSAATAQIARETEAYEQTQIDAAAAEEARQQTALSLLSTMGTFFGGMQEGREASLASERQFNSSITNLRTSAAEAQTSAQEAANQKIIGLEEQRAAEEHRILTGAHARTTELNDSLLAANNAHFAGLAEAESASLTERQAVISADFAKREGQAQAARAKELAEQQAHLEELKLNAALATLESTGQLQQFTGGLAVSASEAAELIRAGVIPVTQELGAAIQGTLAGLQDQEAQATAQLASNQAVLQEAFAGTLVPLEAQALALGTDIPVAAAAAQAATGLANADLVAGAAAAALASQEQDLALQNLGTTTFPTLGAAAQLATQTMNDAFVTAATPIGQIDLTLNNMAIVTLPLLQEAFNVTIPAIAELLAALLNDNILPIDMALVTIYVVTLPTLQNIFITTTDAIISVLTPVQTLVVDIDTDIVTLTATTVAWGVATKAAGEEAAEGFEEAADKLRSDLIPAMQEAQGVAEALAAALTDVASSAIAAGAETVSATGTGFSQGIGFQAGTPSNTNGDLGLGFRIPPGFPNDTFPFFAQSGEEMLITPRGTTIEGLIFSRLADLIGGNQVADRPVVVNNFNEFNMTVNTGASAPAVTRQFEVARGMAG